MTRRARTHRSLSSVDASVSSPELPTAGLLSAEPTPFSAEAERPHRSLRSNLKGRKAVLTSWLKASPLTTSFIEDVHQGTSKQTRLNTMYNRYDIGRMKHIQASQGADCSVHSMSSSSSESLSTTSAESTTSLRFMDKARVFHENARLEDDPMFEDLKKPNRLPPLEVRRYRASRHYPLDPSQPCSAAGRWVQGKRSS